MLKLHLFTFNPFQENTYLLWDNDTKDTAIIDPGCCTTAEQEDLVSFIAQYELKPGRILNTHAHIDHILGNAFVHEKYKIPIFLHEEDLPVMHSLSEVSRMYGIPATPSPNPDVVMKDGDCINVGRYEFKVLFVPGHSPGSVAFYNSKNNILISGDVLFLESIGRTDLPGGNYYTLMNSIQKKILSLPDNVIVYAGHGPSTNIGHERRHNPFILEFLNS